MLTKNELKYYNSLSAKKFRKSEKKFLVEGTKLISEALNSSFNCELVLGVKLFFDENPNFKDELLKKNIRYEFIKSFELDKLSDTKNSQGVVAVFQNKLEKSLPLTSNVIITLEHVSDPGNMGTIIRNCDWFGIQGIMLSPDCVEIFSPKVIRSSAGSVFHINIHEEIDFYEILSELKNDGYRILCADLEGRDIYKHTFPNKSLLVFANEANGPSTKLLEIVDQKITIPGKGKAESLNVASASAVILSELTKNID